VLRLLHPSLQVSERRRDSSSAMGKGTASRQPRSTISTGGSCSSVKSAPKLDLAENSCDSTWSVEGLEKARALLRVTGRNLSQESYNPLCSIGSDESTKESLAAQFSEQVSLREQLAAISSTPAAAHQDMAAPVVPVIANPVIVMAVIAIPVDGNNMPGCVPSQSLPTGQPWQTVRKTVHKDGAHGTSHKRRQKGAATCVRAPPPATEEQWQERQQKRIYAIQRTKSSPVYYEHANSLYAQKKQLVDPDPYNRDFSKRMWEAEASQGAWITAGLRVQRLQAESAASEEHLEFQERLHNEHVQLAVAMLCSERT